MPGRQPQEPVDEALCRRCQAAEPAIVVRNEPLCKSCFGRYVQTKVVKRMESFRVRNSEPGREQRLLLPLTFDASALALLHILSQHLKTQVAKTGRPGYKLCILHVEEVLNNEVEDDSSFASVKAEYPEHEFHVLPGTTMVELQDTILSDLQSPEEAEVRDQNGTHPPSASRSATARQDLRQIILRRAVVQQAKEHGCRAVLWSYSTTKLAEQVLAETAKARGFTLPWVVNDGESPHGILFYFPLRDVLNKEIDAYLNFLDSNVTTLVSRSTKAAVSTRNTTIDALMAQYFENVEREYPSIVANVVRTTSRLQAIALAQIEQQCELCNMPLEGQAPERSRLCYGCIRIVPQSNG